MPCLVPHGLKSARPGWSGDAWRRCRPGAGLLAVTLQDVPVAEDILARYAGAYADLR